MRAVSTVLDAALCLLLVSASALTLAGTPTGSPTATDPDTADEAAELLATSTARLTYEAGGTNLDRDAKAHRTVHDTLAGLLVAAAKADARTPPRADSSGNSTGFVRAVTARVERALRRLDADVQVIARLNASDANPTRGGRVVTGDSPPPNADVHAAAFAVRGVRLTVRTWSA